MFSVTQRGNKDASSLVLPTSGTPKWSPFGFTKQFLRKSFVVGWRLPQHHNVTSTSPGVRPRALIRRLAERLFGPIRGLQNASKASKGFFGTWGLKVFQALRIDSRALCDQGQRSWWM